MEPEHHANKPGLSGVVAGQYRIERKLGAGGMGEVYLATDTRLKRPVAIKAMHPALGDDELARKRFVRETRTACRVNHPYVATVHDVVDDGDRVLLVMEYLHGRTLAEELRERRPDTGQILTWLLEIAEALAAIHAAELVHRDVKPANVMITEAGHVKVTDFGLARATEAVEADPDASTVTGQSELTRSGAVVGTLLYMAPEQLRGEVVDARADQFSFGVLSYEALTGTHPFARDTPAGSIGAILGEAPSRGRDAGVLDASEPLRRAILRLLEKNPARRFSESVEMLRELRDAVGAPEPDGGTTRHALRTWVAVVGGAALLLAAGWWWLRLPPTWNHERYALAIAPFVDRSESADGALQAAMLGSLLAADLGGSSIVRVEGPDDPYLAGLGAASPDELALRLAAARSADYLVLGTLYRENDRWVATAELRPAREGRPALQALRATGSGALALAEQLAADLRRRLPEVPRVTALRDDRVDLAALTSDRSDAREQYERGVLALREGRVTESVEALERAIGIDSRFALAHARLAEALDAAGYGRRAREAATRARELKPEPTSAARRRLALVLESTWARLFDRSADWVAATGELVRLFPDEPALLEDHGQALRRATRYVEADDVLGRAVLLDPRNPSLRLARADCLRSLHRLDEAESSLDEARTLFELAGSAEGLAAVEVRRGAILQDRERYDDAVVELTHAAESYSARGRDISAAETWLAVARALLLKGRLDRAGERIDVAEAIAREAGNLRLLSEALGSRAVLQYYRRDWDGTIRFYREAIDQARQLDNAELIADPLSNLVSLLVWLRRLDEADPLIDEKLRVARDLGRRDMLLTSLIDRAEIEALRGDISSAVGTYDELMALAGERPERLIALGHLGLADLHVARGRLGAALDQLDRAVAAFETLDRPHDLGRALLNRGRLRSALGRFDDAAADFDSVERPAAEYPDLRQALAVARAASAADRGRTGDAATLLRKTPGLADRTDGALLECRLGASSEAPARARLSCDRVLDGLATAAERTFARVWLARALLEAGRAEEAAEHAAAALEEAQRMDLRLALATAAATLANLPAAQRPDDAADIARRGLAAWQERIDDAPAADRETLAALPEPRRIRELLMKGSRSTGTD